MFLGFSFGWFSVFLVVVLDYLWLLFLVLGWFYMLISLTEPSKSSNKVVCLSRIPVHFEQRVLMMPLFLLKLLPLTQQLSLPPLSGGYENFHSHYPELCTEVKSSSIVEPSGSESDKRVVVSSSSCCQAEALCRSKPDYDQVRKHPEHFP